MRTLLARRADPNARAYAATVVQFELLLSTSKPIIPLCCLLATGQVFNGIMNPTPNPSPNHNPNPNPNPSPNHGPGLQRHLLLHSHRAGAPPAARVRVRVRLGLGLGLGFGVS